MALGAKSGAHRNPAVSLGMVAAGRMRFGAFLSYAIAQVAGAIAASAVILMIASGKADYVLASNGLGQNGSGAGYLGEYVLSAAFIFELVATFLFVTVILGATETGAPSAIAGLAIGLMLTAIHLVGINVTGVSVNPARSIGPALLVGAKAMADRWLFILAPLAGGVIAGLAYAAGLTKASA